MANKETLNIGEGRPGPGRPKGSVNKATKDFRETVTRLLDSNAENVSRWLTLVAEGDGTESGKPDPGRALIILAQLAEFAAPKLSRAELTGPGGKELAAPQFIITPVTPKQE